MDLYTWEYKIDLDLFSSFFKYLSPCFSHDILRGVRGSKILLFDKNLCTSLSNLIVQLNELYLRGINLTLNLSYWFLRIDKKSAIKYLEYFSEVTSMWPFPLWTSIRQLTHTHLVFDTNKIYYKRANDNSLSQIPTSTHSFFSNFKRCIVFMTIISERSYIVFIISCSDKPLIMTFFPFGCFLLLRLFCQVTFWLWEPKWIGSLRINKIMNEISSSKRW